MPNIIKGNGAGQSIQQYRLQDNLSELAKEINLSHGRKTETVVDKKDALLGAALKQSEEILAVAREEAEKIKAEAYKEGYDQGLNDGKDEAYWQVYEENSKKMAENRDMVLEQIENSIAEIEEQKKRLLDQHLDDLKNIAIAIAEKVMRVSLQSSGDIIKRMIISSTEKMAKTQWAKIYISKYDAELMVEGDYQLLNSLSYLSDNIKIITMDHEEQGICIIELPKEIIDASINTQMENIRSILSNVQL